MNAQSLQDTAINNIRDWIITSLRKIKPRDTDFSIISLIKILVSSLNREDGIKSPDFLWCPKRPNRRYLEFMSVRSPLRKVE